jgi:hypothetical protein
MPDGLTHMLAGYMGVRRWLQGGRLTLFLVGSLLPDILFRGGRLLFVGHAQHDFLELYLTPLHTPFTALFVCLALAQFFYSEIRKAAFVLLYVGCLGHFLLDFLQRTIEGVGLHVGTIGGYHWLFPLSWLDFQFGLFWAEDAPYALIILIPITGWMYYNGLRRKMRENQSKCNKQRGCVGFLERLNAARFRGFL